MAYEIPGFSLTLPAATGLAQFRMVKLNTSGYCAYPNASTVGEAIIGVITSEGTTGSTVEPQYVTVQVSGVAKVSAPASTVAKGDLITASTLGQVQSSSNAGDYAVGWVVDGSSGGAGRILSVLLLPVGST